MLSRFCPTNEVYNGEQLKPLVNYLRHGLLGDSVVAWQGPCDVSFDHMIDGEDLRQEALIKGDQMLHLVIEIFHQSLHAGVLLQRLIGEVVIDCLAELGDAAKVALVQRRGDDLYWQDKKLNVSIATSSRQSFLIHFGVNITNQGTPVPTCALCDFGDFSAEKFAGLLMEKITSEVESQKRATVKVLPL